MLLKSIRMTPVFIFSLPRSGSTLLQRMLAAHSQIDSCAEPWVLLPPLYGMRQGVFTEYSHNIASRGIRDVMESTANEDTYHRAVRAFGLSLYKEMAGNGATHFVDKTPRYHLVVNDIMRAFPGGKFIFLWRNPLAIVASIMQTWRNGKWNLDRFEIDLFEGLPNLVEASHKSPEHVHCLQYEALVQQPEDTIQAVFSYLELPFEEHIVHEFSDVGFNGELGDPTGIDQYHTVSKETTEKWKKTLRNPLRKRWMRHYLNSLGQERLSHMGYDLATLLNDMEEVSTEMQHVFSDFYFRMRGYLRIWLHPAIQHFSWKRLRVNKRIYPLS